MSTMPKETSAFRVIVVGAGVAGLTASHCFQKSGIDHVVLERRSEIDPPEGASIAIYPHGARILQQIGCLDAAQEKCKPCVHFNSRWSDGKLLFDDPFFDHVRKNHGQDILLFERRRYLRILYDGLPDKSRIRMGATVKDVKQTVDGVEVLLSDGSVEKGDIVIGCDGVYSRVRNFMWDHADAVSPGRVTGEERATMKTRWKCLVGTGPPEHGLGEREMTVVHDQGFSFLALTQPNRSFWFVFFRLDSPFAWPQRANYTEQDAEELAATVADHAVSDTLVFGQLWKKRDRGMLIPLEEGILKHWFSGRVVLAGDAAHKVTPNIALGGNSAMESVVVLCNQISRMMEENGGIKPDQGTLERHLKAYQDEQRNRVWFIMKFSGLITSIQAWDSPFTKFLAVWVLPLLPNRFLALSLGLIIRTAPRLEAAGNSGVETWRNKVESTVKNRFDILRTRKVVGAFILIFLVLCLSLRR